MRPNFESLEKNMSDAAVSLGHPVADSRPFVSAPASGKRLGLGATLVWGAAGIAGLMTFWITGRLPMRWMQLDSYPALVLLSFGHIAAVAVVAAALWSHALPLRDYLALPALRWRDVRRGALFGVLGYLVLFVTYPLILLIQSALGGGPSVPVSCCRASTGRAWRC